MDSIDASVMRQAAEYVAECDEIAVIHTVTLTLNGAHGGADVIIEGTDRNAGYPLCSDDDFTVKYEVR